MAGKRKCVVCLERAAVVDRPDAWCTACLRADQRAPDDSDAYAWVAARARRYERARNRARIAELEAEVERLREDHERQGGGQ